MKKISLTILFSLLGLMTFAQSLKVVVKQNGKVIEPVDNIYELKKSTFQFEVTSTNLEGFLIGATTDENIYNAAVDTYNPEVPWFQNTGMAEELYNKDKELLLMDTAPSYWYFTDAKDHRFDKNPKGNLKKWTATRTITKFYDVMVAQPVDLKDFEGSTYVLMYEPVYNNEYDLTGKKNLFNAVLKFTDL
ncbi:hypothetical protein KRE40_06050 [Elizabethkingia meningoseptica]|uniref:GLPGLI family protein n=1 Tax=Elizabethkingia meningoseptica TaxID=238 RepID=A0A1V3U0X9_ELIME|nr:MULTISPECIES: hypothetical protein [Elizabethkingia]AQX06020.1 hypothetical protein BBD33_12510 [Elizabethkingia meningoseptica]AQX13565.1 hypothetical protein BBD35_14825 [Elizabethkingia meningoseptica]AQX48066.1 hypothetical protein B5G46_12500 [Elizabethkingia meningoseptica]EJK5327543.1 hypothetical protein [Elizabethkingia meningoseptica]EOR30992.1 hypothetical protein L100_03431 [Elizabethkingia meningoseptica ATCC 13253 = NBRC 12535]